jgi:hypothetical protein
MTVAAFFSFSSCSQSSTSDPETTEVPVLTGTWTYYLSPCTYVFTFTDTDYRIECSYEGNPVLIPAERGTYSITDKVFTTVQLYPVPTSNPAKTDWAYTYTTKAGSPVFKYDLYILTRE